MSTSIRGSEGVSFFPTFVEPIQTRWRIVPLPSCLPSHCQRKFSQRGGRSSKAHILHEPSTSRCKREVPTNGKASFFPGNSNPQTQTLISGAHIDCSNGQASTDDAIGNWIEWVRCTLLPLHGNKGASYCWLHRRPGAGEVPQWSIHTDESSTKQVGGVGVVLYSPERDEV